MSTTEVFERVIDSAPTAAEYPLRALVGDHLGADPSKLPLLSEQFPSWQDINVQAGLDAYLAQPGRTSQLVGVSASSSDAGAGMIFLRGIPTLAGLMSMRGTRLGGVEYERRPSGVNVEMACVKNGLLLVSGPGGPIVVWIREEGRRPYSSKALDVLAGSVEAAKSFLEELRRHMAERNLFRGQYVRLAADAFGNVQVNFEEKPVVTREEVILPPGVLGDIEDHAIRIGNVAPRLVASGRHLKRGILLYGPPGTGKTHTIRYLASQLPKSTLFVMTGSGMGWLNFIKEMVADVAPAIVVLDDVDLIAEDRDLPGMAPRELLFSLLDAMDGIKEDADVLFVCTSNRADTLEKAIAARPGRIDQAIELGLPDSDARKRLFDLYSDGLDLQIKDLDTILERTEGVTASFVKELLRRAWLVARADGSTAVTDRHIHTALDALLDPSNPITPALLGMPPEMVLERSKQRGVGTAWCGI